MTVETYEHPQLRRVSEGSERRVSMDGEHIWKTGERTTERVKAYLKGEV